MFRSNQNLLKYIACDQDNPLDQPDIEDIESLFSTRISFRPKVIETATESGTYIIVKFLGFSNKQNLAYSDYIILFDIVTHNTKFMLDDEANPFRIINIATEIDSYINGARGKFLGQCIYDGFKTLSVNESFSGIELAYKLSNFNDNYDNDVQLV
jgi:hypothetical protein